ILSRDHIACGCALLFGLGETHESRIALLDSLIEQRRTRGSPVALSANWPCSIRYATVCPILVLITSNGAHPRDRIWSFFIASVKPLSDIVSRTRQNHPSLN
ncbi:hypothetical protein, partial [Stenotrophomonas maltophilia group sp. RNC7]|uniref:hypothetical protein n=1 Tax=Stenotrophomonas maltophilia group sp. RNC7 TaxID=3071467 RepID=UPI0027E18967